MIINLLTCVIINFPTLLCTFSCSLKNPLLHLHKKVIPLIFFILDNVVMHSILLKTQVKKDIGKIYAIYIPTWWRKSTTCFSNSMSWQTINRLPRRKRDGSSSFTNRITYSALMPWLLRASITDITWCTVEKTWANKSPSGSKFSTLTLRGDFCQ